MCMGMGQIFCFILCNFKNYIDALSIQLPKCFVFVQVRHFHFCRQVFNILLMLFFSYWLYLSYHVCVCAHEYPIFWIIISRKKNLFLYFLLKIMMLVFLDKWEQMLFIPHKAQRRDLTKDCIQVQIDEAKNLLVLLGGHGCNTFWITLEMSLWACLFRIISMGEVNYEQDLLFGVWGSGTEKGNNLNC